MKISKAAITAAGAGQQALPLRTLMDRGYLAAEDSYRYPGSLVLSPGRAVGLRLVPTVRDLRFAWEEQPQQRLDAQAQKVRDSGRAALIAWATGTGEVSDYTDNLPSQCLHPVGHWYEVPNMLRNGVLRALLAERPQLQYLMSTTLTRWARTPTRPCWAGTSRRARP